MKKEFSYTKSTLKFCGIGILIPGFTAIFIIGVQYALIFIGIECVTSWFILFGFSWITAILLPLRYIKRLKHEINKKIEFTTDKIVIFNIIEYILLQCCLVSLFRSPYSLCFVSGGQSGMEFGFTAWMSLPILLLLSNYFDNTRKMELSKLENKEENIL